MKRKYPARLFIFNLVMNFLIRYIYLWIPGLILILIPNSICTALGIAFLGADLAVSLIDQIRIRKASLTRSDNEEYNRLMDAALGAGGPEEFQRVLEERMKQAPQAPDKPAKFENPYE